MSLLTLAGGVGLALLPSEGVLQPLAWYFERLEYSERHAAPPGKYYCWPRLCKRQS